MKASRPLIPLLALAWGFAINPAHGTVFNFSYTFGDGLTASGSLNGTQNGQFVENVSNASLFFNGTAVPGSIFTSQLDGASFSYLSGPVVSFDALQNNFVFSNSDLVNGDFGFDSIFYMFNASVFDDTAVGLPGPLGLGGSQDLPTLTRNWLLTPATSVPDEGAAIVLLGMAMAGMVWLRRMR